MPEAGWERATTHGISLKQADGGAHLRRGVESFLAAHRHTLGFAPAPDASPAAPPMVGLTLGRYRIEALLGRGGMSEVYLALDTTLGRRVALKTLPGGLTRERDHAPRLTREAQAASALNHPNIVTIHEVGSEAGLHYIVTEHVAGRTLRERLKRAPLGVAEVIDIAAQVADALSAAHAAGVIHRDIKPENVMVRDDGLVKVLDFGLAKRVPVGDAARESVGDKANTVTTHTGPGVVLGTVAYMSPEQSRGKEVDARTDVWSLGVLLYEMVAGRRPFTGETKTDITAAVLTSEPQPLAECAPAAPAELQAIINRALCKPRAERYASGREMLADLLSLKRQMGHDTTLKQAAAARSASGGRATERRSDEGASEKSISRIAPAAGLLVGGIKRHRLAAEVIFVCLALVAAGLGLNQWLAPRAAHARLSPENISLTRLTTSGRVSNVAVSPDGKYLVEAVEKGGKSSLQVRPVATVGGLTLVPPAALRYVGLTFSPDSNSVYYVIEEAHGNYALCRVGALGGQPRKILESSDPITPVTFSPDGGRLAYVRFHSPTQTGALMVANADGAGERALVRRQYPAEMLWPVWSPDGQVIAFALANVGGNGRTFDVMMVPSAGGKERPLGKRKWNSIHQMSWLPDGDGLVMAAREPTDRTRQLWLLTWPDGAARRVTNDLHEYAHVSVTGDAGDITTVQTERVSHVYIVPQGAGSQARQITSGRGQADGSRGVIWTPDGQLVYDSSDGSSVDLLRVGPDGGSQTRLTADARANARPAVTADGRYVVFSSNRTGKSSIWRMDADGGNLRQLTFDAEDAAPSVTPDGRWVVYQSAAAGTVSLWKVSIDGGTPERLTGYLAMRPSVSPDGRTVACYYYDAKSTRWEIGLLPLNGGPTAGPAKAIPLPPGAVNDIPVRWSADGKSVFFVVTHDGVSNVWRQPVAGGEPKQVTDFRSLLIFGFDWSRDGKLLACARGADNYDAVLIKSPGSSN